MQETQEKMTAMQNEYRKQIDNLEVNLSTTNGTLLRRDNEIKMLREGVSYISSTFIGIKKNWERIDFAFKNHIHSSCTIYFDQVILRWL